MWVARLADVAAAGAHPVTRAMALVVEVSYSSQYVDRTRKLRLYAAAGVPEYWIVDLNTISAWTCTAHRSAGSTPRWRP